jgi:hypothetical protein
MASNSRAVSNGAARLLADDAAEPGQLRHLQTRCCRRWSAPSVLPGHVVAPLRQMVKRARVRMVTVSEIDLADKTVSYLGEGAA